MVLKIIKHAWNVMQVSLKDVKNVMDTVSLMITIGLNLHSIAKMPLFDEKL